MESNQIYKNHCIICDVIQSDASHLIYIRITHYIKKLI